VTLASNHQSFNIRERFFAWLAAWSVGVLAVCVVGVFTSPVSVRHFDPTSEPSAVVAEIFVPPTQAVVPVEASPASAELPLPAPAAPDLVPVAEAVPALIPAQRPSLVPLRVQQASPGRLAIREAMRFVPDAAGVFPDPPYPRWARQQGMQGKLQLLVDVAPSGAIADLKVRETSGHDLLDKHVLDWVKANWSWAPGAHRLYLVPFVFELQ
jgi:protein TonB